MLKNKQCVCCSLANCASCLQAFIFRKPKAFILLCVLGTCMLLHCTAWLQWAWLSTWLPLQQVMLKGQGSTRKMCWHYYTDATSCVHHPFQNKGLGFFFLGYWKYINEFPLTKEFLNSCSSCSQLTQLWQMKNKLWEFCFLFLKCSLEHCKLCMGGVSRLSDMHVGETCTSRGEDGSCTI